MNKKVTKDNTNSIPAYLKLYRILRQRINEGEYDKRLPIEKELCEEFHVSRLTVRRSLEELKREGVVYAKKGKGTFIAENKREEQLTSLGSFSEEASGEGRKASSLVLRNEIISPPPEVIEAFDIPSKGMVLLLERVRFLDDEPLAIERSYLNPLIDIRILNIIQRDMSSESLYRILREEFEIGLQRAVEYIEIAQMSRKEAKYLQCETGDYGILRHRYTYTDADECIEYVVSMYKGERYKLRVVRNAI
ncbi:MAG: GntR family transcriptional regulator [Petrotogales bacterium]